MEATEQLSLIAELGIGFAGFLASHEPADIVMEACGGTAHFWGRKAEEAGTGCA